MGKENDTGPAPDGEAENVWYLRLFGEMNARHGFTADAFVSAPGERRREMFRDYARTDEFDPGDLPKSLWLNPPEAGTHKKTLPPAHIAYHLLTVSREFLDVLEQFDLGKFVSWPVTLLKKDKKTPFDGEWHAVWIGNRKTGFLREKSSNFRVPRYEDTKWLSIPNREAADGDFVMDAGVKDGPDIWKDRTLDGSLLLSDRLHSALKDAGLLTKLQVLRCPLSQ